MNPWAADKAQQLDTHSMTAFGIRISSRHANAQEMIELIAFACAATEANVNMFVTEAFYDSGSSCCNFTLSSALDGAGSTAQQAVLAAALQTISQFVWDGCIRHGRPLLDTEELAEPL
jgi:hypothetical protein